MKKISITIVLILLFVISSSALFHIPFVFALLIAFLGPTVGIVVTDGVKLLRPLFYVLTLDAAVIGVIVLFPQVRIYGL